MTSTYTTSNLFEKPGLGDYKNSWGTENNENFDHVDAALDGVVSKSATATLTDAEARNRIIVFTGSSNAVMNLPARVKWYIVHHSGTSGKLTVQVTGGGGASVTFEEGDKGLVYCDGTDCVFSSAKRPWFPIQTQATTSGTSKSFGSGNDLEYYTELFLRIEGVSHAGAGAANMRVGISAGGGASTFLTIASVNPADAVYGAIEFRGHIYEDPSESATSGFIFGAVEALTGVGVGTSAGVLAPFRGPASLIQVDCNGETFDAGSITLYGR